LEKNSPRKQRSTKASALLCPACCVEYVEVEFDFEVDGAVLHNVKALRCPSCEEEVFTPEQYEAIVKRVGKNNEL
jgi:autonomous glycyl radical cofactor GrcA